MADIGLMLRRATEREGAGIAPADRPSDAHGADSVHFFVQLSPEAVPILRGEVAYTARSWFPRAVRVAASARPWLQ